MTNVLSICVDDASFTMLQSRAEALGVAHVAQTPNINAFQAGAINYTRFYGQSTCRPTRGCMMLGKYGFRSGVGGGGGPIAIAAPGAPGISESWLCKGIPAVAKAMIGKWHLYTSEHTFDSARLAGAFDTHIGNIANINNNNETFWYWGRFVDGALLNTLSVTDRQGGADGFANRKAENYATHVQTQDAIDWIQAQGGDWFCQLSYSAVHRPVNIPPTAAERATAGLLPNQYTSVAQEALLENYRIYLGELPGDPVAALAAIEAAGWESDEVELAAFIGMMEATDTEIGRLLAIPEIDTATDTWVFIFSDNGEDSAFVQAPADPSNGKTTLGEIALRLPLLVQGPTIPTALKGRECRNLVHMVDLWATTLGLFGIDPAVAFPGEVVDSVDFSATFTDLEGGTRTTVYSEFFSVEDVNGLGDADPKGGIIDSATGETADANYTPLTAWSRTMIDDNWKLITRMATGPASTELDITRELYNMRSDYLEQRNFIREPAKLPTGVEDVSYSEAAWAAFQRLSAEESALLP